MKAFQSKITTVFKNSKFNSSKRYTNKYFLSGFLYLIFIKLGILHHAGNKKVNQKKSNKRWILDKTDL